MLRIRKSFPVLILCLFCYATSFSQPSAISKLEQKLKKTVIDTARLNLLRKISIAYSTVDHKKKYQYAKEYTELAIKLKIDSTTANGYIDMGVSYGMQSQLDSSFFYFSKAYNLSVKAKYERGIARSLLSFGYSYSRLDNKREAVEKYIEALKIFKKLKYTRGINQCYINIGSIYFDMAEYAMAEKYFMASYKTYFAEKDEYGMASSMFSLGNVYRTLGDMKKAKEYYSRSLAIREKRGELSGIALTTWGLGIIANEEKNYDEASRLLEKARDINRKLNDVYQETAVIMSMSDMYLAKGDLKQAESLALEGLSNGYKIKSFVVKSGAYKRLTDIAEKANQIPRAFKYQKKYFAIYDSLKQEQASNDIKVAEFQRVQSENEVLIKNNDLITAKSMSYQKTIFIISVLLVLVLFLSVLLYRKFLEKNKINLQLEKQKQEIAAIIDELEDLNNELTTQMSITAAQNNELEQLNTVKNKFFSIVSHDLRSPLATLQMLFGLYRKGQLSEAEMNEMLNSLEETIYMTSIFLDNLLNWSKSQLDGMVVKPSVFDLGIMINDNIKLLETQAELKKLFIENKIDGPITVFADPNMINVVVRNLISNSVKFCSPSDSITINAKVSDDKVIFSVGDTGPGISKDDLEHLFDLEHTVSVGTSGETGHHIGLILCRDMVEQNNGTIWIESELGKGTVFYVALPNKKIKI